MLLVIPHSTDTPSANGSTASGRSSAEANTRQSTQARAHLPVCVHCSQPAHCLYKHYTPTLVVLMRCGNERCGRVVDTYADEEYLDGGVQSEDGGSRAKGAPGTSWMDLVSPQGGTQCLRIIGNSVTAPCSLPPLYCSDSRQASSLPALPLQFAISPTSPNPSASEGQGRPTCTADRCPVRGKRSKSVVECRQAACGARPCRRLLEVVLSLCVRCPRACDAWIKHSAPVRQISKSDIETILSAERAAECYSQLGSQGPAPETQQ